MPQDKRPPEAPQAETLIGGLRGWMHDGVDLLRVRLELFSLEAQGHAEGVVRLVLSGVVAMILLCLGLGFLAVLLTVLLWDSQRTLALAVFTTLFLGLGVAVFVYWRQLCQRERRWFEATLDELRADVERLRP